MLGSPVCLRCNLYLRLDNKIKIWKCIKCDTTSKSSRDTLSHLFCISQERISMIEQNELLITKESNGK